jgi:branched-chain amino acid transport system permease protein
MLSSLIDYRFPGIVARRVGAEMASQQAVSRPVAARRAGPRLRAGLAPGLALLVGALGLLGVLWKAFGSGFGDQGNVPVFILVTLNGLTLAGLYFISASGLTLIFGLLRVTNLAHGALFLLGGYVALEFLQNGVPWAVAALLAMLISGVAGLVMHQ